MITANMPLAILLTNSDGSPMTAMELFKHGGPIMWPILIVSFILITVAMERVIFIFRENGRRQPEVVEKMLEKVEANDVNGAPGARQEKRRLRCPYLGVCN